MANHVSFNIRFNEMNSAAKSKWQDLTSRLVKENYEYWMGDMWVDGRDGSPSQDDVKQYSWTTENIGPKWCYITDFDEDGCQGYSAWSAPEQGLNWILEQLTKLDPNIITEFTYEDEGPNFAGAYVYDGLELYDGFEDEFEDIIYRAKEQYPDELKDKWDEDTESWSDDESEDFFNEVMWEVIHESQYEHIQDCINYIKEDRKEETA